MKIEAIRTNYGPTVFHSESTVVMTLDLQQWVEVSSELLPDFVKGLVETFPGLAQHTCSKRYVGGFLERLNEGTYIGHITEHVALELSSLCGIGVNYGKTRYAGRTGLYDIVTRFVNEKGMHQCLRSAVHVVSSLLEKKEFDLNSEITEIKKIISATSLGSSSKALLEVAQKRHLPYRLLGDGSLIQLGYGRKRRRLQTAVTDHTSLIAADIAQDKDLTKKILEDNFIPVPKGNIINSETQIEEALSCLSKPYVVKPFNGNHGRGVILNLQNIQEVIEAFRIAKSISEQVIIEEMCFGNDYRVLVINGKLIAAAERQPPIVSGDGNKTLQQLIDKLNQDPARGEGHENILSKVQIDDVMIQYLQRQNIKLNDIIAKDIKVRLRENANLSSGGTAKDVTQIVHPEVVNLCELAARHVGLDICGIDLIHKDISKPVGPDTKIIEMNAGPGLRMHLFPSEGKGRAVADYILDQIFPHSENGRIPIVSVTGTNGKTTTVRLIHKIMSQSTNQVGLTTTEGIWLGKKKIYSGDTTGPKSTRMILSDPQVDMAVLEVARGGILRGGLGYDWSDVGVITNIKKDHIGQNGIEDIDDLVWIKSLVAERIKKGGVLVLNADDENSFFIKDREKVKNQLLDLFLFSVYFRNPHLLNHIKQGGKACYIDKDWITLVSEGKKEQLISVTEIPITMNGKAQFQIANVLAATAAALALGATRKQICTGLREFNSVEENQGRFNIYRIRDSYVILDYGHNEDAFSAIGEVLIQLNGYRKKAILSLPGDRTDDLIKSSAQKVASFCDEIFIRDDLDRRGRKPKEVPGLVLRAIYDHIPQCKSAVIESDTSAVQYILDHLQKNEILVFFYDELSEVLPILQNYDPEPVAYIPEIEIESTQFNQAISEEHAHVRSF